MVGLREANKFRTALRRLIIRQDGKRKKETLREALGSLIDRGAGQSAGCQEQRINFLLLRRDEELLQRFAAGKPNNRRRIILS